MSHERPILYAFYLPDPVPFEDYDMLLSMLSPAEQSRVQRYRLEADRLRSLISRIALWYHLITTCLLSASSPPPSFRTGSRGKPYLLTKLYRSSSMEDFMSSPTRAASDHDQPIEVRVGFNVSHEGNWVLLGVIEQEMQNQKDGNVIGSGGEIEIGVDVMVPPSDPEDLKEALIPQMTLQERLALSIPLSPSRLRWTLSALWALKEGYTKAVGQGVGFGLDRIHVEFGSAHVDHLSKRKDNFKGMTMSDSLPVEGVRVDGQAVEDNGWRWEIGTVGERDSMDEVGWAMWWQGSSSARDASTNADMEEAHIRQRTAVEIVGWDRLISTFDNVRPHR